MYFLLGKAVCSWFCP
ncbi:MAG: 4Fe-4S binding protein [Thermoguttaceae bacterium]|nr:4Fe-4S binding protein [Thermoguttaceae bacterium]